MLAQIRSDLLRCSHVRSISCPFTPDSDQFRSSQIHTFPFRFTQTHPDLLRLVRCHLDLIRFTPDLDLLRLTHSLSDLRRPTQSQSNSLTQKEKGRVPEGKREKGRGATTHPSSDFTRHSDRAYARTDETKRFHGWFAPRNLRQETRIVR